MKKKELKAQLLKEEIHYNNLRAANVLLIEENETLKKELKSIKSMNLTEFYKTISSDNRKSLWFQRMDDLIDEAKSLVNVLK